MIKSNKIEIIDFLKIVTILSYCCIFSTGPHISIPYAIMPFIGIIAPDINNILISILSISIFILYFFSPVRSNRKSDIYLFSISGILLLIPPLKYIFDSGRNLVALKEPYFIVPFLLFLILLFITLFKIYKQKPKLKTAK